MLQSEEISVDKIKSGLGGYKKKNTKEFIDNIRNEYELLCKENQELKEKIGILSEGVQYYKNMEKSLQKALVLAERTTSETVHAAEVKAIAMEKEALAKAELVKKEAQMRADAYESEAAEKASRMIQEAKQKADTAVAQGNEELNKIHSQVMMLVQQYEQYKVQYKQLAMAQMNVLESEAYKLDAPILKTIQDAVGRKEQTVGNSATTMKKEETFSHEEVIHPIHDTKKTDISGAENTDEKKVYVDARGEVVEVREFREITTPRSGDKSSAQTMDPFSVNASGDAFLKKESPVEHKEKNSEPIRDNRAIFSYNAEKSTVEAQQEKETTPSYNAEKSTVEAQQEKETTPSYNAEKSTQEELQEKKAAAEAMKRIERMQIERLKNEEELKAQKLRNSYGEGSYNKKNSVSGNKEEKKEEDLFAKNQRAGEEKPEITLHDLKLKQMEQEQPVPLPKTVNEGAYFEKKEDTSSNMQVNSFGNNSVVQESKEEKIFVEDAKPEDNKSYFEQFATRDFPASTGYSAAEEKNSIGFEMENANHLFAKDTGEKGFKSFRDFTSEF